jgi:hypothetical protein
VYLREASPAVKPTIHFFPKFFVDDVPYHPLGYAKLRSQCPLRHAPSQLANLTNSLRIKLSFVMSYA